MAESRGNLRALIYDPKIRGIVFQVAFVIALILSIWWIVNNVFANMEKLGKTSDFDFLDATASFEISRSFGTWYWDYEPGKSTFLSVFFVGISNTLLVAVLGIIAATVVGFIIGLMRLSQNLAFRVFATVYVEVLRNIPLLLQIFFWYFAVLRALPDKYGRGDFLDLGLIMYNRTGFYFPFPEPDGNFVFVAIAFVLGIFAAVMTNKWARRRQELTGQQFPTFWAGLGWIILFPVIVFIILGMPLSWNLPEYVSTGPKLRQGIQVNTGMVMSPEMASVWLALFIYTGSFIAEIVRAGVLAVNKGQTEASRALGIRQTVMMNLVIVPQALRVIIPPLTSQFLNLTKNSSLAAAVGFPELVLVFGKTGLNQAGQEVQMIFMILLVYLTLSLITSMLMNWYNAKKKLVER